MTQFDRFNPSAQNVAAQAFAAVQRYKHAQVDVEHILLALLEQPDEIITHIFDKFAVNIESIKQRLDDILQATPPAAIYQGQPGQIYTTARVKRLMDRANEEAALLQDETISAEHVLLAILSDANSATARILNEAGMTKDKAQAAVKETRLWLRRAGNRARSPSSQIHTASLGAVEADKPFESTPLLALISGISPVFGVIALIAVISGYLAYAGGSLARIAVFLFVVSGWMVSLSLHEFGHAAVAYWGGDKSVESKGYLTLNPFKYTHPFLSIILPLVFIAMGGIGLPGGAVYINPRAIRTKHLRSLTSAAGPIATATCAVILIAPFILGVANVESHIEFWAALSLLAFLQLTALIFNLLPVPGLDGFGILEPYLPSALLTVAGYIRPYAFFLIFFLFFNNTPVRDVFWQGIRFLTQLSGLNPSLVSFGFSLFRFWPSF